MCACRLPHHSDSLFISNYRVTVTCSLHVYPQADKHSITIGKHKSRHEQLAEGRSGRDKKFQKGKGREKEHKKNKGRGQAGKNRFSRMGQEQSSPIDDSTPSVTLENRSLDALAKYIKDGRAKRIVTMVRIPIGLLYLEIFADVEKKNRLELV